MFYGHILNINFSYLGAPYANYEKVLCGHFPKINISYQGTLGTV